VGNIVRVRYNAIEGRGTSSKSRKKRRITMIDAKVRTASPNTSDVDLC
jgi:hypothetical protein